MSISASGTVTLGNLTRSRMGYGTMRLPGPGVWGPPRDRAEAIAVLRRAVDLGVQLFDTAWYYGWNVANELVAEALHPYPDEMVLITKLGGSRDPQTGAWISASRPEELRAGCDRDLTVLRLESIPVAHFRWLGEHAQIPFEESFGTMLELQREGRIQRLGLSNVTLDQLEMARRDTEIVSVSNSFGVNHREDEPMVRRCEELGIAYLPFFPLAIGAVDDNATITQVAAEVHATPAQVSIAWLLAHSPVIAPIPGTGRRDHLEENIAACDITLSAEHLERLEAIPTEAVEMGRR